MCGIAGFYTLIADVGKDILQRMCDEIVHRGPDDEGYYVNGRVGLGIRRLSIIDLAGGHQPITNEDRSKWIVFNGEIYNYRDLRQTLSKQGHQFSTNTDTEVIVHQYEQDGIKCVHKFNGMFALAVWDEKEQCLFLARDRLGVKPLYYYWDGRTFLFASEIKAILASGLVEKRLNERALWDYLTFRYVPEPNTIWQKIYKLPPGHTLTLSAKHPEPLVNRYWDIQYQDSIVQKIESEYIEEFTHLFLDAVRMRLIADVPVGILLSGGIDSSSVAAAAAEVHNAPLNSFCVGFEDGGEHNELTYARQVAQHIGLNHNEVVIGVREFLDFLPDFVRYTDEPLADLPSVPLYYVSRLAKQKVKVVLSGEGSDEVLAGYGFDKAVKIWSKLRLIHRLPYLIRSTVPKQIASSLRATGLADFITRLNYPIQHRNALLLAHMTNFFSSAEKLDLWRKPHHFAESTLKIKEYYNRCRTSEPLHQLLYVYCQSWLVEDLLMKADKMTMANSIELRVPFLDFRLVEWAARSPAWLKVGKNGDGHLVTKYILRRFAEKRLPQTILTRPKKGFSMPVYKWLATHLRYWACEMLLSSESQSQRWFRIDALRQYVDAGVSSASRMDREKLWVLLVFELWARHWQPK